MIKGMQLAALAALSLSSPSSVVEIRHIDAPPADRPRKNQQKVIAEARERRRVQEAKDAAFREKAMAAAEAKRERKRMRRAKSARPDV